jgi:hypothetical protein
MGVRPHVASEEPSAICARHVGLDVPLRRDLSLVAFGWFSSGRQGLGGNVQALVVLGQPVGGQRQAADIVHYDDDAQAGRSIGTAAGHRTPGRKHFRLPGALLVDVRHHRLKTSRIGCSGFQVAGNVPQEAGERMLRLITVGSSREIDGDCQKARSLPAIPRLRGS